MNKILSRIIVTLLFLSPVSTLQAQQTVIYGMKNVPQYSYNNPARQPACKTYVGFPALSSISANFSFNGLAYDDIFMPHPSKDSFYIDLDHIQNTLGDNNLIGFENHIAVIDFGFSLDMGQYITFSVRNKTQQFFGFSNDLLDIRKGNYNDEGKPIVFDLHEEFINYNEYSVGYSKRFFNDLTIGGRLNLLSGNAHIETNSLNIQWYTETAETELYPWTWQTDIDANAAMLAEWEITYDDDGMINGAEVDTVFSNIKPASFALSKNLGLSLDAGIDYRLYDWLNFSAGVKDFGFIKWKTYPKQISQKGEFEFTGVDIGAYVDGLDSFNDGIGDSIWTDLKDSLLSEFNPEVKEAAYTSFLNTKFTASAEFYPTDNIHFGLLYYGLMIDKKLYSSISVSANANFWRGFSFSMNYSVANRAYNNIGMGLAYRLGPMQMYFVTDNIAPALYMWDKEFTKNFMYNTRSINLHFGINFVFCNPKYDYGLMF